MEFKPRRKSDNSFVPVEDREKLVVEFDVGRDELERARLGFQVGGQHELGARIKSMPRAGISHYERAQLVVAGNLALLNTLADKGDAESIAKTRELAQATVESGLASILEADTAIIAEPSYI